MIEPGLRAQGKGLRAQEQGLRAEGYERDSSKDRAKFLTYAKGSCAELRTQIYIGMEAGYIDKEHGSQWVQKTQELSKMLFALIKYFNQP